MTDTNRMTTAEVVAMITAAHKGGIADSLNPFLLGEPGTGKTSTFRAAADALGIPCTVLACASMTVEDFGFPDMLSRTNGPVSYRMPHWFPTVPSLLVFDDLPTASADVQKVLSHLICEREMHGHRLPAGTLVAATGNRAGDRAGAARPFSHLLNRMAVIQHTFSLPEWRTYAASVNAPAELMAFSHWKPELVQAFDPQRDINPTARQWLARVAPALGVIPQTAELPYFSGVVGDGAAVTFCGFLREWRNLPDLDQCLTSPLTAMVPATPGGRYGVVTALAARVAPAQMDALVAYIDRLPPEYGAMAITMVARRNDDALVTTAAYTRWYAAHGASLLF